MNCPIDNTALQMTERSGVEIDYCPQCRGVWLDRGELDKIIDRSEAAVSTASAGPAVPPPAPQPQAHHPQPPRHDDRYRQDGHHGGHGYHKKPKRESFIGDLFDF